MNIYYDHINRVATATWHTHTANGEPVVTHENFEEWKKHWKVTASVWAKRCEEQGLAATAKHIHKIARDML